MPLFAARLITALWLACFASVADAAELRVHFFDVGQGDAALIVSPTGKTVLIDAGPPSHAGALVRKLKPYLTGPVDLLLLSHPHLDHLGGMDEVIHIYGAKRYMDPGFDHPSQSYEKLLRLVGQKVGSVSVPTPHPDRPREPVRIGLGDGAVLAIHWPRAPVEPFLSDTRSDANSNSIVAKLSYGQVSFLFTGDAEPDTEERLVRGGTPLRADVLKVAHHGSRFSTTSPFVEAVRPRYAVISCGADNEYGHPGSTVLRQLESSGARVLRTDRDGDITAWTDGTSLRVEPAASPTVATPPVANSPSPGAPRRPSWFVARQGEAEFHVPSCAEAKRIPRKRRRLFVSREEAAATLKPAVDCRP